VTDMDYRNSNFYLDLGAVPKQFPVLRLWVSSLRQVLCM